MGRMAVWEQDGERQGTAAKDEEIQMESDVNRSRLEDTGVDATLYPVTHLTDFP